MQQVQGLGVKAERNWRSLGISVAVHLAALLLVGAGEPGLPAGSAKGKLYALTYLGEVTGDQTPAGKASPAPPRRAAAPKAQARPEPKPVALPKPVSAKPKPAAPPAPPAARVLTSPKGDEKLAVAEAKKVEPPAKEHPAVPERQRKTEQPTPSEKPPERASNAAGQGDGGGTASEPSGSGGEALPAPPRGAGLVAALPRVVYPKAAQNAGVRGTVRLRVTVGTDGRVVKTEIERSAGEQSTPDEDKKLADLLDASARRSVERGLAVRPWLRPYALRIEVRFSGGAPEIKVLDEPVEVVGG